MERKTSIQFIYTESMLPKKIFGNWSDFYKTLKEGPNAMKEMFLNDWNSLKKSYKENKNIIIEDIDREVTLDDFDVTINKTGNGINIFYFRFPDHRYGGAAQYVALALTPNMPQYYTLEYSSTAISKAHQWAVCKIDIDMSHSYLIGTDNNRLEWFSGWIIGLLEKGHENMN